MLKDRNQTHCLQVKYKYRNKKHIFYLLNMKKKHIADELDIENKRIVYKVNIEIKHILSTSKV